MYRSELPEGANGRILRIGRWPNQAAIVKRIVYFAVGEGAVPCKSKQIDNHLVANGGMGAGMGARVSLGLANQRRTQRNCSFAHNSGASSYLM